MIGKGAIATIYRNGNTAMKRYDHATQHTAELELTCQRFAVNAGLPVPKVHEMRILDGNVPALLMDYVDGSPLIHPTMGEDEFAEAMLALVKLQCQVHRIDAVGLPKQADHLGWKITHTGYLEESLADRVLLLMKRLDDGQTKLCHGDFHPLNILFDGQKHWIIDWMDATAGSPLADACRTYLLLKQHMNQAAEAYLGIFCGEAGVAPEGVLAWMPVFAAARMSENMDGRQKKWLLGLILENEGSVWRNTRIQSSKNMD